MNANPPVVKQPDPLPIELLATDDQRRLSDPEIDELVAEIRAAGKGDAP